MRHSAWKTLLLSLSLSGSLWLSGCAHQEHAVTTGSRGPAAASFYPLAVGNRWAYQARFLGEKRQTEVQIVKEKGGFYFDTQGGELTADAYGVRDQKRYLLRDPLEPGRTWTNVVSVSSVEYYRVVSVGEPCEVPAGKFEGCVTVEGKNRIDDRTSLINELTFAPAVGLVRVKVIARSGQKSIPQTELALSGFELNKPLPVETVNKP